VMRRRLRRASAVHDDAPEYWVAYSDLLVSLLMVFALLLFLTLSKMQKNVNIAKGTIDANTAAVTAAVGTMNMTDGVNVVFDPKTQSLSMADDVLFALGSASLRPEAQSSVRALANGLFQQLLGDASATKRIESIVVEGHTDTVGTYLNNLDLSQRRAQAVMRALDAAMDTVHAPQLRELIVASGRSKIEALRAVRAGTYDATKARRIVIRVRFRNDELLDQIIGPFFPAIKP